MTNRVAPAILYSLRRGFLVQGDGLLTDAQLLQRYVVSRDELAFEVLVRRHGALVWNVCRRVLRHHQDAEDAFQATFLTLARKAGAIGKRECVASWLHTVAYRAALGALGDRTRHTVPEAAALDVPAAPGADPTLWRDLRPVLDEEISRLPEKYRAPFLLCYVEGKTNEEAAHELGCPKGTVATRLAWARERLRTRLAGRGIGLPAGLAAVILSEGVTEAAVPGAVLHSAVRAALPAVGGTASVGAVSVQAAFLSKGVVRAMFLNRLKVAAASVLAFSVLGAGGGVATYHALAGDQPAAERAAGVTGGPAAQPVGTGHLGDREVARRSDLNPVAREAPGQDGDPLPAGRAAPVQAAPGGRKPDLEQRLREVEEKLDQLQWTATAPPAMAKPTPVRASTPPPPDRALADLERRLQGLEEKLDRVLRLLEDSRKNSP